MKIIMAMIFQIQCKSEDNGHEQNFCSALTKTAILEFHLQENKPSKLKTFPGTRDGYANKDFLLKFIYFCLF